MTPTINQYLRLCLFLMCGLFLAWPRQSHALDEKMTAPAIYAALTQNPDWLNTSRPLVPDDLKGRIILIDFWTYCCINCIHVMPKLQELEHEFGDKLTVIGVHSAKFATEGETASIREAVQKYGLEHPVVNDADFRIWNAFGANAWPTIALIGPEGILKNVYRGEGDIDEMRQDIKGLIARSGDKLVTRPLPIVLEKNKVPPTVLRFPTKLAMGANNTLIVSDSGHQRILVIDMATRKILHVIGNGQKGYRDGSFADAQFADPQGVLIDGDDIFVADTGNHRLRLIDLEAKTVTTLAGTGERGGYTLSGGHDAQKTALASPWDLAFYPDKKTIVIANAGTHQLWAYDRREKTLRIIAGSGQESMDDGHLPSNSLSQPSGLSVLGDKLYFVDAETSSLRVFDGRDITTLIGKGLFDFGLVDGDRKTALMQHAIGLVADTDGVTIADTYNHRLRRYRNGKLSILATSGLREPNGVIEMNGQLVIADTNNHRLLKAGLDGENQQVIDVLPMEKPLAFADHLPNVLDSKQVDIASDSHMQFILPANWHINADAPNYLAVFDGSKNAILQLKTDILADNDIRLALPVGNYMMQGIIYYCENTAGSQCLIRGVMQPLSVGASGAARFSINLPIQNDR